MSNDLEDRSHRTVAIVQARLGSVRMPRKVLRTVLGRPVLAHLLERLRRSQELDEIVLAIPDTPANSELADLAASMGVTCFRGSESDVLDRYFQAASAAGADAVVRITGDCPMVDPEIVDALVKELHHNGLDDIRTGLTFPNGFDVEVCTFAALERAWRLATDQYDREHVTPFVQRDPSCSHRVVEHADDLSGLRVTLDEPEDLEVIEAVFDHFGHDAFVLADVAALARSKPALFDANRAIIRDEGAWIGTGMKLWKRAKRVIPGGNMLLSKRAEMHLPGRWPAYFTRASGCRIWDLDGVEYVDVGLMGVGTNILGYGHPKVDEAARRAVDQGNLSTLNCPEEVFLAERLVGLHPWAEMARFTRSGGEACAVAVRIARAASGRDGVAMCGYHGWHDWYLSANLAQGSALDGHLLPGLDPVGVPRALAGTAHPFAYNDLESLEAVLSGGDVGVVFMEVERNVAPAEGFLEGARALADRHDAVLVFDECTSGFRRLVGGLHLHYGVDPDLAVFGKTLGNGYAINAVIGRREVMEHAQDTFISSTFWTERIGPSAAVATLAVMEEEEAPQRVHALGLRMRERWHELADDAGLAIRTSGIPALGSFAVEGLPAPDVKTFITQELLEQRLLGGMSFYASTAHTDVEIDRYLDRLHKVFVTLSTAASEGSLQGRLKGETAHVGFHRLN